MTASELNEDIYTHVQAVFRTTPVVLAGSGFSCAYGLPHMGELGKHLIKAVTPRLKSENAKLLWGNALAAVSANLEHGLNTIANGAAGREEIVTLLREETANLVIKANIAAERKILSHQNPADHAPARLLRKLFDGAPKNSDSISIVTTNYDTLFELFCDIAELPLDTGFAGFRRRKPRISSLFSTQYNRTRIVVKSVVKMEHQPCLTVRLHKPHGSVTWSLTPSGPIEVLNEFSPATAAIVVPGPSKYQDALVNTLFDGIRTEMNSVFNKANSVLCLGFGFNDDHLQGVMKARLNAHMPLVILTRDATENIQTILKDFPHVIAFTSHNTGSNCQWKGQVFYSPTPLWQLDTFLKTFIE